MNWITSGLSEPVLCESHTYWWTHPTSTIQFSIFSWWYVAERFQQSFASKPRYPMPVLHIQPHGSSSTSSFYRSPHFWKAWTHFLPVSYLPLHRQCLWTGWFFLRKVDLCNEWTGIGLYDHHSEISDPQLVRPVRPEHLLDEIQRPQIAFWRYSCVRNYPTTCHALQALISMNRSMVFFAYALDFMHSYFVFSMLGRMFAWVRLKILRSAVVQSGGRPFVVNRLDSQHSVMFVDEDDYHFWRRSISALENYAEGKNCSRPS